MSETIQKNRALAVTDVATIPQPPDEFKPSAPYDIQSLRKLADKLEAEAIVALEECEGRGDLLAKELGSDVPAIAEISALKARKKMITASKTRLAFLLKYLEELDDIANHDIVVMLDSLSDELEHNAKKRPQLLENYTSLQKYGKSHGDAVKEGRERAKQKKE